MKARLFKKLAVLFLLFSTYSTYSQGCSDAGFCTVDSFKPHGSHIDSIAKNQFKFGLSYGSADFSVSVISPYIEYKRILSEKFSLDAKLTALSQSGNSISKFGLSDIYLNGNYRASEKVSLTLGVKIPLTNGNITENGLPLPMDYQSSLGTFDLIVGLGYKLGNFQLATALQQPLSQNDNMFLSTTYPVGSRLRDFPSTNNFKRSGDVLLRVSYPIEASSKLKITPSILPIYHLANDKFTDAGGVERENDKSRGLTLNANAYFGYELNDTSALQLSIGGPLARRDVRPDGLTRGFVVNLEYRIRF